MAESPLLGAIGCQLSAISQDGLGGIEGPLWNRPANAKIAEARLARSLREL